jgi:small subunit ribosomal protein S17
MNSTPKNKKDSIKRVFSGTVVSCAMQKTIVVRVERIVLDKKYKKAGILSRKYKVHDEKGQYQIGEQVEFQECRPFSKDKRWQAIYKKELSIS